MTVVIATLVQNAALLLAMAVVLDLVTGHRRPRPAPRPPLPTGTGGSRPCRERGALPGSFRDGQCRQVRDAAHGELDANRALCRMLGYTPEELRGKTWQDLTPAEEIGPSRNAWPHSWEGNRMRSGWKSATSTRTAPLSGPMSASRCSGTTRGSSFISSPRSWTSRSASGPRRKRSSSCASCSAGTTSCWTGRNASWR
jgi:hypothetical protein